MAEASRFLEYEDDDEELSVKRSFAVPGPSYEEDHTREQFRQDFEKARMMQKEKADKLAQIQNDEQKAKMKMITQEYNEKFRHFAKSRSDRWAEKTSMAAGSRNFLHHLAYENSSSQFYPQYLVLAASTSQPQLMSVVDGKGRTPLTAAITEANGIFCHQAVLRPNAEQATTLGKHLEVECKTGREYDHDREATCLHAALAATFYERLNINRLAFITKLISLVPKAMFNIQDSKGRTPLHLAVQYENCSPDQVLIVKELLAKGPEALSVESQELGRDLSIFQFHELSKENYEQRRKSLEQEEQKKQRLLNEKQLRHRHHENMSHDRMPGWTENKGPSKEEKEAKFGTDSRKSDLKKADSKLRRGDMEPPPLPDKIGKADANVAVRISRKNSFTTGTPQTREPSPTPWQPERRAVGGNQLYQAVNTPVLKSQAPPDHRLKVMGELESGRRDAAAAIAEILKLCCLRTYEPQKASRFLRSLNGKQDKALWFDFGPSGQPRKLRWKEFQRNFRHFQFDSILQYVAFPHIDLARKTSNQDEEEGSRSTADAFPMVALFNWLRDEERGVKRIIRVIVNDFDSPSHTDEAIEKALYNFDVEILDWRRLDLCPASLTKIGSHLREITLYWGGSNAVLRGWSERDGLARLENLEVVNIVEMDGIETVDRVKQNLKAFEARLYECWPKGKAKPRITKQDGRRIRVLGQRGDIHASQRSDHWHDRGIDPHKWLDCMKKFSDEFRHIKEVMQRNTDPGLSPVVVALIDDGTDFTHDDFRMQQNFEGRSFSMYTDGSGIREDPWWHSESGHGTLMARLIKAICPSAIIHVIKLSTNLAQGSKKLQIDPQSAIKAIEYATELGSHIISMSWTIKPPEEPLKGLFLQAVNSAMIDPKGILMFCAAADQGNFTERTFPHTLNSNIFRIGAAAATGKVLDKVGARKDLSFTLPGHEVVIDHWYDDVGDQAFNHFEPHSGSSVATALAAALAALIIECVRLGVIHTNACSPEQQNDSTFAIRMGDLKRIRERETMRKALSSINTDIDADPLYLQVWDLFEKNAERLKAARIGGERGGNEQLEIISGLARHFLRKGVF